MEFGLKGRHVAILVADGVDGVELRRLRGALGDVGAATEILSVRRGEVRAADGEAHRVDRTLDESRSGDFDALVIPGGRHSAEALEREQRAVQFVREFMAADRPVAASAEGVGLLVAADAVAGRSVAAPDASVQRMRAAGAQPVDSPVAVDEGLITARGGDAGELAMTILREFASRVDEERVDQLSEQSFPASDPPPGPVAVGGEGASTSLHLDPRPADGDSKPGDADSRA